MRRALIENPAPAEDLILAQARCPAGSVSCGAGRCCPNGTTCTGDGHCVPRGVNYCGGGKYCQPGYVCAPGGGCRLASAPSQPPRQRPPGESRRPGDGGGRQPGEDRQPGGGRQPGGEPDTTPTPPLPPGPVGRQPAPREDTPPAPPPAPRQDAPPPPPPVSQPAPPPPRPAAPIVVPGTVGDGRVNGSCDAYYGSMLDLLKSNARQCGISSAKLQSLTDAVLGPKVEAGYRGILKRGEHPDIFPGEGAPAGWTISGNFAKPNCGVPAGADYSDCARTYVCAMLTESCGRDLARQAPHLTCQAAAQQCQAKNPVPGQQ